MSKYQIRYERMNGDWYYMIYQKYFLFGWVFIERWNTQNSVTTRILELLNVTQQTGEENDK